MTGKLYALVDVEGLGLLIRDKKNRLPFLFDDKFEAEKTAKKIEDYHGMLVNIIEGPEEISLAVMTEAHVLENRRLEKC